jgi:5-methylcytosine-specific restriction protein A
MTRSRAAKVCTASADCPHLQPCPVHPKVAWEGSTRRRRLPPDWERLRRRVLAHQPICNVCGDAVSLQVDHVVPGDDHSIENLQGICDPCHKAKTQAEAIEARRTR